MQKSQIIRITHVRISDDGACHVSYYADDVEHEIVWQEASPHVGDLFQMKHQKSKTTFIKIGGPRDNAWKADGDALRWRKPISPQGISRMEVLKRRHKIRHAVRHYFDAHDFTEIDAPLLVKGTTPDPAIASFKVDDHYLATSTEYAMKRLAVGGFERIYSLTQNFRAGDTSTFRNPEFTMLEWGRIGGTLYDIENDVEKFTLAAMRQLNLDTLLTYQNHTINMQRPWERLSVQAAIQRVLGVRINDFELESCRLAVRAAGLEIKETWADDRDFLFSLVMDHLQTKLGFDHPVFITDWPLYQTTSAKKHKNEDIADRSELFIAGLEISDGFSGVADAETQIQFFNYAAAKRKQEGLESVRLDDQYIGSLRLGAPGGAGMALGFDRLVMVLTNQSHIKNVLALNWDEL
jgi:elongation factor P--beta-lysine ligase